MFQTFCWASTTSTKLVMPSRAMKPWLASMFMPGQLITLSVEVQLMLTSWWQ